MMKTDLEQAGAHEMRERAAAASIAESTLDRNHHAGGTLGVGVGGRSSPSFRHVAGTVLGALHLQSTHRSRTEAAAQEQGSKGKEMGQWEVQQLAAGEENIAVDSRDSTTNQVALGFQTSLGLSRGPSCSFSRYVLIIRGVSLKALVNR